MPVEDVRRFETELLDHIRASEEASCPYPRSGSCREESENKLVDIINDFKKGFAATGGGSVVPDEHVEALDEDRVEKEAVQDSQARTARSRGQK